MVGGEENSLVVFRNVSVYRGSTLALDRIDLRIEQGEHLAILGPNGSGKSTLVKAIFQECYPLATDDSHFSVFGRQRWNLAELRSKLGVVSNDPGLFGSRPITGLEAVLSGFFSSIGLWPHLEVSPWMRHRAEDVLHLLEAGHLADRCVSEMSSGEARRILVARALVHDPCTLVFDEPSNSLDLFAQDELRQIMRHLAGKGITILLVTHHLPDIIPEIKRVIFVKGGKITQDGPKDHLLTASHLRELFQVDLEVTTRNQFYHAW
ncbi:ABC transporter ATP-binding protein [Holophaga foetida]|uniref:ABC transporter ATP-binding protein n=1 Tax=Holophaga foetida TaxID=35839 RepID=UPI0002473EAD|nr:ATP-binding cassette domain-containing protein [Holophaga foetida]